MEHFPNRHNVHKRCQCFTGGLDMACSRAHARARYRGCRSLSSFRGQQGPARHGLGKSPLLPLECVSTNASACEQPASFSPIHTSPGMLPCRDRSSRAAWLRLRRARYARICLRIRISRAYGAWIVQDCTIVYLTQSRALITSCTRNYLAHDCPSRAPIPNHQQCQWDRLTCRRWVSTR
jgi:hypothetical protein